MAIIRIRVNPVVIIRQYDADGRGIDYSYWIVPDGYALHVLTYDVIIRGCARVEYTFCE